MIKCVSKVRGSVVLDDSELAERAGSCRGQTNNARRENDNWAMYAVGAERQPLAGSGGSRRAAPSVARGQVGPPGDPTADQRTRLSKRGGRCFPARSVSLTVEASEGTPRQGASSLLCTQEFRFIPTTRRSLPPARYTRMKNYLEDAVCHTLSSGEVHLTVTVTKHRHFSLGVEMSAQMSKRSVYVRGGWRNGRGGVNRNVRKEKDLKRAKAGCLARD